MAFGGLIPFFCIGYYISFYRLKRLKKGAEAFRNALEGTKPDKIYRLGEPYVVEVLSRVARRRDLNDELIKSEIELAEKILRTGTILFPKSPYLHIV